LEAVLNCKAFSTTDTLRLQTVPACDVIDNCKRFSIEKLSQLKTVLTIENNSQLKNVFFAKVQETEKLPKSYRKENSKACKPYSLNDLIGFCFFVFQFFQ
jgi:hypothetical protein